MSLEIFWQSQSLSSKLCPIISTVVWNKSIICFRAEGQLYKHLYNQRTQISWFWLKRDQTFDDSGSQIYNSIRISVSLVNSLKLDTFQCIPKISNLPRFIPLYSTLFIFWKPIFSSFHIFFLYSVYEG